MPHSLTMRHHHGLNRASAPPFLLVLAVVLMLGACASPMAEPVPPPTDDEPVVESDSRLALWWMRPFLTERLTPSAAEKTFGPPDEVTGSGLLIYIYHLQGGQRLWLGFPGEAPITYAVLENANGTKTELPLW